MNFNRLKFLNTALLTLIVTSSLVAQRAGSLVPELQIDTSTNYRKINTFFVGSHLCRKPMPPMAELKHDMKLLAENHFNLVKIQTHWALDEPKEGKYDFGVYDELISYAETLGLKVYLGFTCEQAPAWLWEKYPDCRMVGKNGSTINYEAQATMPADGKPGPCFDSKGASNAMNNYIKALVRNLGKHKNIALWNTWQEIGYWDWTAKQPVCYCTNTLNHFRSWLQLKYGTLDSLNKVWYSNYSDWKYVKPNVGTPIGIPQDIEWSYFIHNVYVSSVLKKRSKSVREADPYQRPVFAHLSYSEIGSGQDWNYARCQDFCGSSSYPAWSALNPWDDGATADPKDFYASISSEMINNLSLNYDYLRSFNQKGHPVFAAEFQGGPCSLDMGFSLSRKPSAEDIKRWMFTVLGSGVTGISFWNTRSERMISEANGFGLLNSTGDSTGRFFQAGMIAEALGKNSSLFATNNLEKSKVAIIINEQHYSLSKMVSSFLPQLTYSIRGWHRMLFKLGISTDFVEVSGNEDKALSEYKVLILPMPISVSNEVAKKLIDYVKNGGILISEACPGRFTEYGIAERGELNPALKNLFGVEQEDLLFVREPDNGKRWTSVEAAWNGLINNIPLKGVGGFNTLSVQPNIYIETFKPTSAEAILKYGDQVAGVKSIQGKGQAYLLGTIVGHNGTAYCNDSSDEFVAKLLTSCGVQSAHKGEFSIRKRIGEDKQAWIITNPTKSKLTEIIKLENESTVTDLFGNILQIKSREIQLTLKSCEVQILIVIK